MKGFDFGFVLAVLLLAIVWLCCPGAASAQGCGFGVQSFGGYGGGFNNGFVVSNFGGPVGFNSGGFGVRSFSNRGFNNFRVQSFGGGGFNSFGGRALNINVNSRRGFFGRRGPSVQIRGF